MTVIIFCVTFFIISLQKQFNHNHIFYTIMIINVRQLFIFTLLIIGSLTQIKSIAQTAKTTNSALSYYGNNSSLSDIIKSYDQEEYAKVQNGDAEAQFNYAEYLESFVQLDEAAKWFFEAAKQNHPKAIKKLKTYAENGHTESQYLYGNYLTSIVSNREEAAGFYIKAADKGHVDAALYVGLMYELGLGVEEDFIKASNYYYEAFSKGSASAALALGDMYRKGLGVEQTLNTAFEYYNYAVKYDIPQTFTTSEALHYLSSFSEMGNSMASYYYAVSLVDIGDLRKAIDLFKLAVFQEPYIPNWALSDCQERLQNIMNYKRKDNDETMTTCGLAHLAYADIEAVLGDIENACKLYFDAFYIFWNAGEKWKNEKPNVTLTKNKLKSIENNGYKVATKCLNVISEEEEAHRKYLETH